ncbi:MAG: hypothetical protein ABJO86_00800 [Lentilitoribacter sp.]
MPEYEILKAPDIDKHDTPDFMREFHNHARRTGSVATSDLIELSDHLILCRMNPTQYTPPSFIWVGRQAQSRAIFGNSWADNVHKSQATPIKNYSQPSALGYLSALVQGFNYDIVRFQDAEMSGVLRRLIMPMKAKPHSSYGFFATMIHYEEFDLVSGPRSNSDRQNLN